LTTEAKKYTEEIVEVSAADGVHLTGAVIRPAAGSIKPLPIVWIHGFTGRFYEPHALMIGRRLAERGYVFVTGNNRGHDVGTRIQPTGTAGQLAGAFWENLQESPLDIDAWITFALTLGDYRRVALVGHSLGGMKSTYYMGTRGDDRVQGLVIASGPVWRYVGPAPDAAKRLDLARQLVAEGRGTDLLPVSDPVSAQNIANGAPFRDDLFGWNGKQPASARIKCPIFAFIGTEEEWIGKAEDLEALKRTAAATSRLETRIFKGADHCYVGHEVEVADAIAGFVDSL